MPAAHPKEFRHDVVAVARRGDTSIAQIARDFGISESCLRNWMRRADIEDGNRPGVTTAESEELRALRRSTSPLLLEQSHPALELPVLPGLRGRGPGLDPGFHIGLTHPLRQCHRVDPKIGGDLLDRHAVLAGPSHANDIVTELLGVRFGHNNILPGSPTASHIRCHLPAHQPPVWPRAMKARSR